MIDTLLAQKVVLPLPCPLTSRQKKTCVTQPVVLWQPSVSKIILCSTDIAGIHTEKGLAGREGGSFRVWAGAQSLCHFCIRMAHLGWAFHIILMSCFLVLASSPPKTQPTGSFAAVSQLLSRSLSPEHVFVCSALGCFLFAPLMLLPIRVCPLVR